MGLIHIEDMEFYAYHGCFKEEQIAGNRFMVSLTLETDMSVCSQTDNVEDALNYQTAYLLVKEQIDIKSHLLENVSSRILDVLFERFEELESAVVKVSKMNPPMGGQMKCVSVEQARVRE